MAEMFYRAVAQAVIIFGLDAWVILAGMERKVEGTQTGFLRNITGKRSLRKADRRWETPRGEVVQEAAGTHSEMNYTWIRKGNVEQWVALLPIFEVCSGEKVYGGGRTQEGRMVASRGGGEKS